MSRLEGVMMVSWYLLMIGIIVLLFGSGIMYLQRKRWTETFYPIASRIGFGLIGVGEICILLALLAPGSNG